MRPTFTQQVKLINEASLFFAVRGYHVTTSFYNKSHSMEVCVYFHDGENAKFLEGYLRRYADDNDEIEYQELTRDDNVKFYTLKLTKYTS